ncbi:hypothetical protein Scep_009905 [Stephania cephalantha]|uniref:Uncharacterized protein n=1 Tax=Stephania cephalantha TaxID=152367 RepID=A0AAP0JUV0_9MAGN
MRKDYTNALCVCITFTHIPRIYNRLADSLALMDMRKYMKVKGTLCEASQPILSWFDFFIVGTQEHTPKPHDEGEEAQSVLCAKKANPFLIG